MNYEFRVFIRGGVRGFQDTVWSMADEVVRDNLPDAIKAATKYVTHEKLRFKEAKVMRNPVPEMKQVFTCCGQEVK